MRSGFVRKPLPCLNRHPSATEKSIVCLFATPANLAILGLTAAHQSFKLHTKNYIL